MKKVSVSRGILILCASFALGAVLWGFLHVNISLAHSSTHNMHPGIVFFLLPVMCAICLAVIAPLHFFGAKFFAYENWRQWATAGFLYSSLFVFFVFPWAVIIVALINPITLRFFERYRATRRLG